MADGYVEEHAGQEQSEIRTPEQEHEQAIVQEVVDNFALVCSIESAQRAQEDEDLEFEGVDQWLPEHRSARAEHIDETTGRKVPARPTLTVNLVEQKVQEVVSEGRQARLSLSVQPKAGLANTKMAGYFKGLIRSIQADSGATEVRLWSLERTAKCGRGAYRIEVDFNNDGDFDLDILIRRILNQGTVYWDPYAQLADRSDADWAIVTDWMSEAERLRRWPSKPIIPPDGAFSSADDPWFAIDDHEHKSVRVATYYKVAYSERLLVHHPSVGVVGPAPLNELPPELQTLVARKDPSLRVRRVEAREVRQYILDGSQVLEEDTWLGRYIPIVPTIGKEYNVKGKRSWKGLVTNCKDSNRGYNVALSSALETVGTMPRAPYIMAAGQDEGFEEMWDDSPIKAYTRLYYNPVALGDKLAPAPHRENLEPAIQGALFLARVFKDDIGSLTGRVDPAQRAVRPYDRSGRAIEALQRQGSAGTSNFLDNLATISMMHEGRILLDLIPKVFDRPGRIVAVTDEEADTETAIILKMPFVYDEEGTPVPVPCPTCQGTGQVRGPMTAVSLLTLSRPTVPCPACQGTKVATHENMPREFNGQPVEYVDLSEGQFKITVAIGRNYLTKQEEAMDAMSKLASAAPALVPLYADLWVRSMGFSGANEIADRIKRNNPAAQDPKGGKDVPPEFMAKYQQLVVEHQAAMAQLQKASEMLKTDAIKTASAEKLQAMKLEAAEGLEHLRRQNRLMEQTQAHEFNKELEAMKANIAAMRQESEQRHEALLEVLQAKHLAAKVGPAPAKGGVGVSVSLRGDISDPMARQVLQGAAAQDGISVDLTPPPPPKPAPVPTGGTPQRSTEPER